MERRRRRQDDGPWNRPQYGSAHSSQQADYHNEVAPQYQHSRRTGSYTDSSHGRSQPPVPWDSRAHHQNVSRQPYGQLGNQTYGGSERRLPDHGAMESDKFHHGHSYSLGDREAQAMLARGNDRIDMANTDQKAVHHGAPHSDIPPHMASTEQKLLQHGGPPSSFPLNKTSSGQTPSLHGNLQSAVSHHMTGVEQRISQHGGPQSDMPPYMTNTEHGGRQSNIPHHHHWRVSQHGGPSDVPPNRTCIDKRASLDGNTQSHESPHEVTGSEQRISRSDLPPTVINTEHGGPHFSIPSQNAKKTSSEQRIYQHGFPPSGVPPNRTSNDQRALQHMNTRSDIPPHMAAIEQRSQHGAPRSDVSSHVARAEREQPHSSISPHMASIEQRASQFDGPRSDIPPHMANTEQRISQQGGPPFGVPSNRNSTDQRALHHGNPQAAAPHHMAALEQGIFQYGGPRSDVPSHLASTEHGGPHSRISPHMAGTEWRVSQHGGPQSGNPHFDHRMSQHRGPHSDIPSRVPSSDERTFQDRGPQSDIPSDISGTEQRVSQHGGPHSAPNSMTNIDQGIFKHDVPQPGISPHMVSSDQRISQHRGSQSDNAPHMASTEHSVFLHGGSQSGLLPHGSSQPRGVYFGVHQNEGQHSNELQLKSPGQEMFNVEDSQKQGWRFQNAPHSAQPGIPSFKGSQPDLFNPTLNRPPPDVLFQQRLPPPSMLQSSMQLPPGPVQSIQHSNNPVQSHYSFPPPLHGPPMNSPAVPSFVHPPHMGAVFSGPPSGGIPELSHIQTEAQHQKSALNQDPFTMQSDGRSENTALFNPHRLDNHFHQEIRPGHTPDPFITSEVATVQNNLSFSENSFQAGDGKFFHHDVPDIRQDQPFTCQPVFNEQHDKSFMHQNRQSEMLVGKDDPSDKDMFQRWLYNFLACRRNKLPPKPDSVQSVSLPEARNLIYGALTLVSQLRSVCKCLENSKEEGQSWAQDYEKAKDIKADLAKKIKELDKPGFIQCVKMKLDRVRKKRLRCQRRRQAKEEEEKEAADRVAEREAEIDSWRMQCVQKVEEKKKERELKAAADSVLGEVRKKQADAKKMLDMLKSLEKLRKLRKEAAARKGVSPPPSADETFKNHISRLRSMVHKRIALYDAEERALRVILEGEQEEERQRDKDKRLRKQREKLFQKQRELDSILFGDDEPLPAFHPLQPFRQYFLQAEQSVVSLVQIRHEWDRFLAPPDHPDATSIPRGWVLPMPPSSDVWATALKPAE